MDHFSRCGGDILAQPERPCIGMSQLPALHVVHQMLHPGHQACALRLHRFLQRNRIGKGRIGRAHRLDHGADRKTDFALLGFGNIVHLLGGTQHIIGHMLVALPHQIEHRMLPLVSCKTPVFGIDLVAACLRQRCQNLPPGIEGMFVGGQRIGRDLPAAVDHFGEGLRVHEGR